jgi:dolichol kinase
MGTEINLELKRQAFHLIAGLAAAFAIAYGILEWKWFAILFIAGIILSLASTKAKLPVISWFLDNFERKDAAFPGKGALFMVLSAAIVAAFFDKSAAAASIAILAAGDSVSHVSGKMLGKTKHPFNKNKLIEGTLAGFLAASAAALIFVPLQYAVMASAIAMLIEGFEIKLGKTLVDDNLIIPIAAAITIYVLRLW